jgi:hypothetical protein
MEFEVDPSLREQTRLARLVVVSDVKALKSMGILRWEPRDEPASETYALFEGMKVYAWGAGADPTVIDYEPILEGLARRSEELGKELEKHLPRPPGREDPPGPLRSQVTIELDRKPAADVQGGFRFAVGMSSRTGASWFAELRREAGVQVRRGADEVTFDLPARGKKIVLDGKTGALRLLQTTDFDGTVRAVKLVGFAASADFPAVERPKRFKPSEWNQGAVGQQIWEQLSALNEWVLYAFGRWSEVEKAGKESDVTAVFTRWGALWAGTWRGYALRRWARESVRRTLEAGWTVKALREHADERAAAFKGYVDDNRAALDQYVGRAVEGFVSRLAEELKRRFGENRRFEDYEGILRGALDFDKVEKERSRQGTQDPERLFKEEVERAGEI